MPVPSEMVGSSVDPVVHDVDERWTMAYAASLGDELPAYFDTTSDGGVVAHPLFSVCPEWPVIVRSRELSGQWGITPDEVSRSVHATHDVMVHRPIRPGDQLSTSFEVIGIEARKPGTFSTFRLETVDGTGDPVATSIQGSMYLGVPLTGPDQPTPDVLPPLDLQAEPGEPIWTEAIPIAAGAAHTYTECARIWNPIHTDIAVAERAGLPGLILHGTANLALAVSALIRQECEGDPTSVARISGRFRAMVAMPSTIEVRLLGRTTTGDGATALLFDLRTEDDTPAVDAGVVVLRG